MQYYTWLCELAPSPIAQLNRAIVVMQVHGPEAAFEELEAISQKKKLEGYYLYHSLLGEIQTRLGNAEMAQQHLEKAIQLTQSEVERRMLEGKRRC